MSTVYFFKLKAKNSTGIIMHMLLLSMIKKKIIIILLHIAASTTFIFSSVQDVTNCVQLF